MSNVDLLALAEGVLRGMLPAARARAIDLGMEMEGEDFVVIGIEWLLREAAINLVDNALRYCRHGGRVTLRLSRCGDDVVLAVEDEGPGMTEKDIAGAGVRFRRGSAGIRTSGAGLGLAIVATIAQAHSAGLTFANRTDADGLRVSLSFSLIPRGTAALRQK